MQGLILGNVAAYCLTVSVLGDVRTVASKLPTRFCLHNKYIPNKNNRVSIPEKDEQLKLWQLTILCLQRRFCIVHIPIISAVLSSRKETFVFFMKSFEAPRQGICTFLLSNEAREEKNNPMGYTQQYGMRHALIYTNRYK